MANKKNIGLVGKALEYTGALLTGGIGMAGAKAFQDYKAYQEENSWENSKYIRLKGYFESKDYLKTIDIANEILNSSDDDEMIRVAKWISALSHYAYALQIKIKDLSWDDPQNKKSNWKMQDAKDLFCEYGNEYGWDEDVLNYYLEAECYTCTCWMYNNRNLAILLLGSSNDSYKHFARQIYDEGTKQLFEELNAFQYRNSLYRDWSDEDFMILEESKFTIAYGLEGHHNRKYIFIGRDIQHIAGTYQLFDDERVVNWIFTLDQLPQDIVFPLGRPQSGLYMAHPVKTEQYFPIKNIEETLFMEKVREFCWLAQCLGAREVSFHSIKGMSVSEGYGSSMNVEANIGVKSVNVGGNYGNSSRYDGSRSQPQQVERVQHFDPKKKAYCPDDLVWLDSDPAWKDLIKQRLNGNMLDYTYKISSSETCQMSSNEKDEVKANFEYMMVKVNGSYNSEKDTTFSSSKETEWSIHVEFAPLSELTGDSSFSNTNMCLSKNDQEYLNEVKDYIEDYGKIGLKERKYLEKTRMRLDVSESRAAELEASICQPKLTNEEKEYLDEVKELKEDYGKIGPRERKYLEKTRIRLGISPDRAAEIERM